MKSSSAGSAHCRSSITQTNGPGVARYSRKRRHAVNRSPVWPGSDDGKPTRGASRARSHCRSASGSERQGRVQLRLGIVGTVGVKDPAFGLDDLSEGPERDSVSVREASAPANNDMLLALVEPARELGDQPRLAGARLADDGDHVGGVLARPFGRWPAGSRSRPRDRRTASPRAGSDSKRGVVPRAPSRAKGAGPFPSLRPAPGVRSRTRLWSRGRWIRSPRCPRRRDPLKARGRVHDVPGHHALVLARTRVDPGQDLAGVDPRFERRVPAPDPTR